MIFSFFSAEDCFTAVNMPVCLIQYSETAGLAVMDVCMKAGNFLNEYYVFL